jgi:hypothetical protein
VSDRLDLELLASRVAELVLEQLAPVAADALLDADDVARRLGVTRSYVYDHAAALGARRLGEGRRARLRFVWADVLAALPSLAGRGTAREETRATTRSRRRPAPTGAPLVPIRGASVPNPAARRSA